MSERVISAVYSALDSSAEVLKAKLRACRTATEVALQAMQICRAYGTPNNTPFAAYLRDAETHEIGAGSAVIMKNTVAKHIIREIEE